MMMMMMMMMMVMVMMMMMLYDVARYNEGLVDIVTSVQ